MRRWYKNECCRGSYALGTACGKCEKCVDQREQFAANQRVHSALNTPSSALREIRELKERAKQAEAKLAQAERERDEWKSAHDRVCGIVAHTATPSDSKAGA